MTCPPQFLTAYPLAAAAFLRMARGEPLVRSDKDRTGIKTELLHRPIERPIAEALFAAMWTEVGGSRVDFATRTSSAFRYFGVCDEVRGFVGGIWGAAFRQWHSAEQMDFLRVLVTSKAVDRDLALEFLPTAIPDLKLAPQEFWGWIIESRSERGFPHRLPDILKRYAEFEPMDALAVADLFLRQLATPGSARFVAQLVHWVRELRRPGEVQDRLNEFEHVLALGPIEHRSILLESWAFSAASPLLDEATAIGLKERVVRGGPDELTAWCFVVQQLVLTAPAKLPWAARELRLIARSPLIREQKGLAAIAALHGWLTADPASAVSRAEWESILKSLGPLISEDTAVWEHLEYALVDAFENDATIALALVTLLAASSGAGWSEVMEANHNKFSWWCQTLQTGGYAGTVVTRLCFSAVRSARRVALNLVRHCGVTAISSSAIQRASAAEAERLLLEAAVRLGEYDFIARLHLAFADRVEQLGGNLAEWFLDEVLTQALNTNLYRQTILKDATAPSKIRAIVEEAERRLDQSTKASESPALRMRIPGQTRAESLHMRRFGREVAKRMEEHSGFMHLFPTIQLLYGKSWRMPDGNGSLGAASTLNKVGVTSELPRLEFMTPEAMRHRRIMAVRRIVELDKGVDDSE